VARRPSLAEPLDQAGREAALLAVAWLLAAVELRRQV
jgi:hypothetical protein